MFWKLCLLLVVAVPATAHDTWVETNVHLIRTGDAVNVDLKLGNHGNSHRDFKLASKLSLGDDCTLELVSPDGTRLDLSDRLNDVGYAPTEGYWTTRIAVREPGLYIVGHSLDRVVNHGRPIRSIKSGKTCFVASASLDQVSQENSGFDRSLGYALELTPITNPVTPMGPGSPISIRLTWRGQPLANEKLSFIPRGTTLAEGFDATYERTTDSAGAASFTPTIGQTYLVVAHKLAEDERGPDYEATSYSATLTVFVPDVCPCCAP